jgi:hypothetical protein
MSEELTDTEINRLYSELDETRKALANCQARCDALRSKLAEAETDAERYRWLRDADRSDPAIPYESLICYALKSLDEAIDAARRKP